ncbi:MULTISPECIES: hypothetical protein [Vibrio]|uniref:hypothetical protein n=1 Tax=Vibrio TaxID=662 RepID=UPI0005FA6B5C|nr:MULTISPECIES: hypothetical protein [Vibrio]KJY87229.1 hypothetical protein TW84_17155 [Vibrio neptunius]MDA0120216.1 hypothetical protein [Vibrio sp. T11.5]NRB69549.1 hypothetical protein [Vibrio sp.]
MKQQIHQQQFEQETQQAEKSACFSRFGTIVGVNEAKDSVRVDFEGNPFGQPLSAKLGRGFTRSELKFAMDNKLHCRIEFVNQDISLPIVTDVFFSMLSEDQEIILRAEKMTIETNQELTLKSGDTQTRYSGRDGRVTTEAKYVTSQAEKAQKIQGGTVAIN